MLKMGVAGSLEWGDPTPVALPITQAGDLITGDAAGLAVRLAAWRRRISCSR